jgi:hypothetical protein
VSKAQIKAVFAQRLHLACNGLSHREVGDLVGLPGETIRRYRKGITAVPLFVAAELCQKLDLSPTWLMLGEGPHRRTSDGGCGTAGAGGGQGN